MLKTSKLISPISIDLGAKNTGVYQSQFFVDETPFHSSKEDGYIIQNSSDNITWSLQSRTAKRHQIRGNKRRKLAKRLLWVIIKSKINLDLYTYKSFFETIKEVNGLLNKRGFTYFTEEINIDVLEKSNLDFFVNRYNNIFNSNKNIYQQLISITSLLEFEKIQSHPFFNITEKDLKVELKNENFETDEIERLIAEQNEIKSFVNNFIKSEKEGNSHRKKYLSDIYEDINNSTSLNELLSLLKISTLEFRNLIGNISNLQLRVLRKYFNDSNMKSNDIWDDKRLFSYYKNWIIGWHPDLSEKENRINLIKKLNKTNYIYEFFLIQDPVFTIPPYEDQNNRKPPKCTVLSLDFNKLSINYPDWIRIANKLLEYSKQNEAEYKLLSENIFSNDDLVLFFQRTFDISKTFDPFKIRELSKLYNEKEKVNTLKTISELPDKINKFYNREFIDLTELLQKDTQTYINIANDYYEEITNAKIGLWSNEDSRLLKRCDHNTKQKKNCREEMLAGIFGIQNLSIEKVNQLENFLLTEKIDGRTKIMGAFEKLSTAIKKSMGDFNFNYSRVNRLNNNALQTKVKDIDKSDSEYVKYKKWTDDGSKKIIEIIPELSNLQSRFNNPYSLAQIYNILKGDTGGFSKTCMTHTRENTYRSSIILGTNSALSNRLVADSVRPFDGQLSRMIERIAFTISNKKISLLENSLTNVESLYIPIVVEENKFLFAMDLAEIKRSGKKKIDPLKESLENQLEQWKNKSERIKSSANNICAYTGNPIVSGEIDHIIPRSYSKKLMGTTLNSEFNLLYVSNQGNQIKSNHLYTLNDLNEIYLLSIFGTTDRNKITDTITLTMRNIYSSRGDFIFHSLSEEEKNCVKFSLFIEDLRDITISLLGMTNKTKVNGTQAYLAKLIKKNLSSYLQKEKFSNYKIDIIKINSDKVYEFRNILSETYPQFKKSFPQTPGSHVIDATLAFVFALSDKKELQFIQSEIPESGELTANYLNSFLPSEFSIKSIERKAKYLREAKSIKNSPLFNDGIYAENFLPLFIYQSKLFIGFSPENSIEIVKNPQLLFNGIFDYILYNRNPIKDLYDFWLNKSEVENRIVYFEIDKQKSLLFLHEVAHSSPSELDWKKVEILDSFIYRTQKYEISSSIISNNKLVTKDELLKVANFKIKVDFELEKKNKIKGDLILPVRQEWQRLLNHPLIDKLYSESIDKKDFNWTELYTSFFPNQFPSKKLHKKVRKKFSLPMIKSVSGGYRVKRKNKEGEIILQLIEQKGGSNIGFPVKNNKIDLNKDSVVTNPAYQSKNLTPLDLSSIKNISEIQEVVPFNHYLNIEVPEIYVNKLIVIKCCPHSKTRFYFSVIVSTPYFLEYIYPYGIDVPHRGELNLSLYQIPDFFKLEGKNSEIFEFLPFPRDGKIYITNFKNESLCLEYEAQGKWNDEYSKEFNKKFS